MSTNERLLDLVLRWEQLREQGQPVTPEELCRDCAELLPELKRCLQDLQAMAPPPGPAADTRADAGSAAAPPAWSGEGGRYRAVRLHDRGGLGEVHVARDDELQRRVALKRIQGGKDDADSRRRFLREAWITARLQHPGIVPVYGLTRDADGGPCYAMRFIEGQSLRDAIQQFHDAGAAGLDPGERRLRLRQLLARFVSVCKTVAYAHSRGLLHFDLKPANVMLGAYDETLVVDWGLARPFRKLDPEETGGEDDALAPGNADASRVDGFAPGTPPYMSPEQAEGRWDAIGPASDIYSLGATLYTLLTGTAPFHGGPVAVLRDVRDGRFARPRAVKPTTPRPLEAVTLKAMARAPEGRYATASALAEDLERWLADEPVTAYREPWPARAGRWLRRHRTLVTSGVATLLVALLLTGASTLLLGAAYDSEHRAKMQEASAKEDAQTQRDTAVTQKKRADDNLANARKAVEDYLNKVTDHPRLKEHNLRGLRKELLKTAVPYYEDFVRQKADDHGLEAERGRVYLKLAVIRAELGEKEQAVREYKMAREIFGRLADAHPDVPAYREELANCHYSVGAVLRWLGKWPEAEAACREAIQMQQALADASPAVPAYRHELARSHGLLALLLSRQGKLLKAEAAHRVAAKLGQALADALPAVPEYRLELARNHNDLGILLFRGLGKPKEAEEAYREAIKLYKALAEAFPGVAEYRRSLATTHNNLANLLSAGGKREGVEDAYREAIRIQQAMVDASPDVPEYRLELARSYNNLAVLFGPRGKGPEAESAIRTAIKLQEALVRAHPAVPEYGMELARSYNTLGAGFARMGKHLEAVDALREAVTAQRALAVADPAVPAYRQYLATFHFNLGGQLEELRKWQEAEESYRESLRLLTDLTRANPEVSSYRLVLDQSRGSLDLLLTRNAGPFQDHLARVLSLARSGEHTRAAAAVEALVKGNTSGAVSYCAACALALSAAAAKDDARLREKYAARAVALLRELQKSGYFNEPVSAGRLKNDADLGALRQRDDFRKLLARVEKSP
jgi:serine/threonine-protein kinase